MTSSTIEHCQPIATGIYLEGLAVDPARSRVWYSDVVGGGVHGIGVGDQRLTLNPERMWTGGLMPHADGSVLSSGGGGIMWNNPATGASGWLLRELPGEAVNGVNEMAPDGEGGLFFGTLDLEMVQRGGEPRPTQIYRLSCDGELRKLADDIGFTNGLMYDPERRRLYCNDTFLGTWMFDVTPDWCLEGKRLLLDKADADGMALDAEGNVWITGFQSGAITRISPAGERLPDIQTPARAITQVRFGGADLRDVYFNTVPPDAGATLKDGGLPDAPRSVLYQGRSPVPGRLVEPVHLEL